MKPISAFTLEKHSGPYELWPSKSRVYHHGAPTKAAVAGYNLLHQFECADGYLLITDHDCPFEEIIEFTLLSRQFRPIGHTSRVDIFGSPDVESISVTDARTLEVAFYRDHHYALHICQKSRPLFSTTHRLSLKKITNGQIA